MSKILDKKSAGYSFALHVLQELEHHLGDVALQGGLGISLTLDHTRKTGDIDMSVSAGCLMQLETEMPALVKRLFQQFSGIWTRCVNRDQDLHIRWNGQHPSRRLLVSWWPDDQAHTKERVEFEFLAVPDTILHQYPPQLVCVYDICTESIVEFMMRMPSLASALADKIAATVHSTRIRLIDHVDAFSIIENQSESELVDAARALESILTAYTTDSIDALLRRFLTNRPLLDDAELVRQRLAITGKIPANRLEELVGDLERFDDTRARIRGVAFAMLAGAGYIRSGGPKLSTPSSSVRSSLSM